MQIEPVMDKWTAFGWRVLQVDGHDPEALLDCFAGLPDRASEIPTVIIAHTVAGKGVSFMEDRFEWHLGYLAPEDQERALADLETDT
jgi:transketolase